jgi:hypothetical protein
MTMVHKIQYDFELQSFSLLSVLIKCSVVLTCKVLVCYLFMFFAMLTLLAAWLVCLHVEP